MSLGKEKIRQKFCYLLISSEYKEYSGEENDSLPHIRNILFLALYGNQ